MIKKIKETFIKFLAGLVQTAAKHIVAENKKKLPSIDSYKIMIEHLRNHYKHEALRTGHIDQGHMEKKLSNMSFDQVKELFDELYRTVGNDAEVGAHFHDTRGLGLANAFAALEAGVRELDASLAGLGGCPYAPGASGNIVTEDLVFMLESMGLRTGIDLDGLMEARKIMEAQLKGEPVHGTFANTGLPLGFQYATAA